MLSLPLWANQKITYYKTGISYTVLCIGIFQPINLPAHFQHRFHMYRYVRTRYRQEEVLQSMAQNKKIRLITLNNLSWDCLNDELMARTQSSGKRYRNGIRLNATGMSGVQTEMPAALVRRRVSHFQAWSLMQRLPPATGSPGPPTGR